VEVRKLTASSDKSAAEDRSENHVRCLVQHRNVAAFVRVIRRISRGNQTALQLED
jgi:hypothetical protein